MDDAKQYANNRIAFGNPISKYQLIREKFAKFWAWYEASWNYAYKCAWMIQNKIPCTNECMLAKYHCHGDVHVCRGRGDEDLRRKCLLFRNILPNVTGEMPNSCFMAAAPMKCSVTIWEGSILKD